MRWHTNQWAHTPLGLALCGAVDSPTSACMPFIFLARVFFFVSPLRSLGIQLVRFPAILLCVCVTIETGSKATCSSLAIKKKKPKSYL